MVLRFDNTRYRRAEIVSNCRVKFLIELKIGGKSVSERSTMRQKEPRCSLTVDGHARIAAVH